MPLVIIDTNVNGIEMSRTSLQFTIQFVAVAVAEPCNLLQLSSTAIISATGLTSDLPLEALYNNPLQYEQGVVK